MGALDVLCTSLNISEDIKLFLVTLVFPLTLTLSVTQNSLIPLENVLLLCEFHYLNIHLKQAKSYSPKVNLFCATNCN